MSFRFPHWEAATLEIGMRVLQVIDSLIPAGAEVLVKELAPVFQVRGLNVTVAVLKILDSPLEKELRDNGVHFLPTAAGGIYSPRQILHLAKYMGDYDLVHAHLFPVQLWTAAAVRLCPARPVLVTTEHNPDNNRRRSWLRPLDRWLYRAYDAIACNSQATADALAVWAPGIRDKLQVVPNGIPLARFGSADPIPKREVVGSDVPVVTFVARLEPQKDHATLLRSMAAVSRAHLLLVGDGELRPRLGRLAQELGIQNRVHFLGRRSDVPQLLKMSDVYVHSTHSDGFGMAAVEAMAAGVPVIASLVPGLAEVVGGAGVLVPVGDSQVLAKEISALLASPARREQLSEAGRERALQFTIEACAEAYIRLYESLLAGRRQG